MEGRNFAKDFLKWGIVILVVAMVGAGILNVILMDGVETQERKSLEELIKENPKDQRLSQFKELQDKCFGSFNTGEIGFDQLNECILEHENAYYDNP